jgi:triacylglycerol lipase
MNAPVADTVLCAAALAAYSTPATFAFQDVHAVMTETDGVAIIAFRGTVPSSWEDWFRDCAAWPTRLIDHPIIGPCHSGFADGADALLDRLRGVLSRDKPYMLTGHSLGGALAIAAGALLCDCGLPPTCLTTFGAPRVGMGPLAGILTPITGHRYRHGEDPVPEVPTWPYLTDRAWTRIGTPGPDPIADHAIAQYMLALEALPCVSD